MKLQFGVSSFTQDRKKLEKKRELDILPLPPVSLPHITTGYHTLPPEVKKVCGGGKVPQKCVPATSYHWFFFMIPELTTTGFEVCGRSTFSLFKTAFSMFRCIDV